jgi:hypothetical protein
MGKENVELIEKDASKYVNSTYDTGVKNPLSDLKINAVKLEAALRNSYNLSDYASQIMKEADEIYNLSQNVSVDITDFESIVNSIKNNADFFSTVSKIILQILTEGLESNEALLNVINEYGVEVFTVILSSCIKCRIIDSDSLKDSKLLNAVFSKAIDEGLVEMSVITSTIMPNMIENGTSYDDFEKIVGALYQNKFFSSEDVQSIKVALEESETGKNILSKEFKDLIWQLEALSKSSTNIDGATVNGCNLVYYSQDDSKWKRINYNKNYPESNIGSSACGFTSLAMIVAGKEQDSSINPETIMHDSYRWNEEVGGFISEQPACSWEEMGYIASEHGIETNLITSDGTNDERINLIFDSVEDGNPVVVLKPGHYYVVCPGEEKGQVTIMDPKFPKNNGTYTPEDAEKIVRQDGVSGVMSFSWDNPEAISAISDAEKLQLKD